MIDVIGWFAAAVLLATIGRQVYSQWRDRSTKGLSRWLFIGQIIASLAFIVYSWLLGNWVFVATNLAMLGTAVAGEGVLLANRLRSAAVSGRPTMSDAPDAEGVATSAGALARADQEARAMPEAAEPEPVKPGPAKIAVDDALGPLASDLRTVFLGGTFMLLLLAACYSAAEIILPIVVSFVLMLVLQPAVRFLKQWHVPRGLAAALLIITLFGALGGLGTVLSGPATSWSEKVPAGLPKLEERLKFLGKPIAAFQRLAAAAESLGSGAKPLAVTVEGNRLSDRLLSGTRNALSGVLETVVVLFFLLVSGDTFLRRLVEVLPHFRNKRQAVDISQQIESDISAYLATITLMNAGVGVVTGIVTAACGLGDPVLWGAVAFLLNYVPILGPIIGVVIFLLVGLLSIDTLWAAFLPAGLYLAIHVIEGETITPLLLARRFTVNPVLVIVALVFWYWMWGVPGAVLATPMLAVTKIICDRVQSLAAFGHFIEG